MVLLNFYNLESRVQFYFDVKNKANPINNWISDPYAGSRPGPSGLINVNLGGGSSLGRVLPSGPARHDLWMDDEYDRCAEVRVSKEYPTASQPGKLLVQLWKGKDHGVDYLYYVFYRDSPSKKQGAIKVNGNKDFRLVVYNDRVIILGDTPFDNNTDGRVEEFGWQEALNNDGALSKL